MLNPDMVSLFQNCENTSDILVRDSAPDWFIMSMTQMADYIACEQGL